MQATIEALRRTLCYQALRKLEKRICLKKDGGYCSVVQLLEAPKSFMILILTNTVL